MSIVSQLFPVILGMHLGGTPLTRAANLHGACGVAGVLGTTTIPFLPL